MEKRTCVRFIVTGENIISGEMAHERSLKETKMVKRSLLKLLGVNIGSFLDENYLAQKEG